ncbi:MAG: peptidase, partial [Prevotella sp.]
KSLVFGKNISNGTYYLVPMFATNADGSNNWKACANSSMYIKLNISDKEMLTTVFANRSDIECKMLKHEGQAEENIETKLTATIANNGISNAVTVYIYDKTSARNANAVGVMIDANTEKTVELPYTPRTAGKHLIELYADNARKIKIGEIEINVKGSIETSLTQSGFKIKNAQGNVVKDKFECEVTIENWGNDTYKNKIVAILSDRNSANVETLEQNVEIKDDEKKTLTFAFTKMQDGNEYCVKLYYINKNLQTRLSLATPKYYVFRLSNGIEVIENGNSDNSIVTIYRINGSIATRVQQNMLEQTLKTMPRGVYIVNGNKYLNN